MVVVLLDENVVADVTVRLGPETDSDSTEASFGMVVEEEEERIREL